MTCRYSSLGQWSDKQLTDMESRLYVDCQLMKSLFLTGPTKANPVGIQRKLGNTTKPQRLPQLLSQVLMQ